MSVQDKQYLARLGPKRPRLNYEPSWHRPRRGKSLGDKLGDKYWGWQQAPPSIPPCSHSKGGGEPLKAIVGP